MCFKRKQQPVEMVDQALLHTISTKYNGFKTFNGSVDELNIQTIVVLNIKKQGDKEWYEVCVEQPDILIKNPYYDCEYATNKELLAILGVDLIKAKMWVAENCDMYKKMADVKRLKFVISWK